MGLSSRFKQVYHNPTSTQSLMTVGGTMMGGPVGAVAGNVLGGSSIGQKIGSKTKSVTSKLKSGLFGSPGEDAKMGTIPLSESLKKNVEAGRAAQLSGLGALRSTLSEDPTELARSQAAAERLSSVRASRAAGEDTARRLQEQIAQRGMGTSSVGLAGLSNIRRQTAQDISRANVAEQLSLPERIRALRLQQAQGLIGGAGQVLGQPGTEARTYMQPATGGSGGLAPLLGAGLGAYFGGAQGAQIGAGLGKTASGTFQS